MESGSAVNLGLNRSYWCSLGVCAVQLAVFEKRGEHAERTARRPQRGVEEGVSRDLALFPLTSLSEEFTVRFEKSDLIF